MKDDNTPGQVYHVVTAVWGAEFGNLFLDICVPNQLSPANLAALPAGSRYRIFTTAEDALWIEADPRLDAVRRQLPVDVVGIPAEEFEDRGKPKRPSNRYKMMTTCHQRAIAEAAGDRAVLIFLSPDIILSEGTMAALVRRHIAGARAVLTTGLRLSRESFMAALGADASARTLPPRQLVALALQHLHPWTDSLMVNGRSANEFPTSVYWPVRSGERLEGILVRALHLHPLLVDPVRRSELPRGTIDGHYLMRCCPKLKECHVVEDSDEFAVFELTPAERNIGAQAARRGVSLLRLAAVSGTCDRYQLSHGQRVIRLHAGELGDRWSGVEAESLKLVRALERCRPYGPALFRIFTTINVWRQRSDAWARSMRRRLRPPVSTKQVLRPAKLAFHRAVKQGRLQVKRIRRHGLTRHAFRN